MRNCGNIERGATTYRVYESDELVESERVLSKMSTANFNALMVSGQSGDRTTIIKNEGKSRLDKQNPVPVSFNSDKDYDNLSIQIGDLSVAVLYIKIGFLETFGVQNDVAGLRALFATNRGRSKPDREQTYLLRVLYTWLAMSNSVNRKMVITTKKFDTSNAIPLPAIEFKAEAKKVINSGV